MSAVDVTDEEIQDFSRLFPASRRLATALKASRAEVAALRRQVEERGDVVTVPREEWEVLDEIAKIARPRCKKLDESALRAAVLRLDKIRAPGDWESTPGTWRTGDALRSGEASAQRGEGAK